MVTGMTIIMVDGVIMMDGVIERLVDGGRVQMSMFTLDQFTPPTDTMRILLYMGTLLHMGITDTLHMRTTRTKNYAMVILQRPGGVPCKRQRDACPCFRHNTRVGDKTPNTTHLKQGKAIPDPIATAKATGQHFSTSANQVEITPRPDSNPRA